MYDKKPGQLTVALFKNGARKQEMTVISSVYWDLLRIYDTSSRYGERQSHAADRLAEFLRFTPIYGHVVRRAETQMKTAKNPQAYKRFLQKLQKARPRCFIATSAFESQPNDTVFTLCEFRDSVLKRYPLGRMFVKYYYRISPGLASGLDQCPCLKPFTRAFLRVVTNQIVKRIILNHFDEL